MKTGVTTSVIAHAALLIIAIVGLGSAKPLQPEVVESIAVDLVPISDITNIRQGSLTSTVVKTETPAVVKTETPAQLAQKAGNTEEDQPKPEETAKATPAPVVNTAPKPVEAPQPKPEPDPVKDPTPAPQPVAQPDPAPSPDDAEPQQEVATDTATDAPQAQVAPMPALRPAQLQKAPPKPVVKTAEVTPKKTETPKQQTEQSKDKPKDSAKIADQVAELINSEKSRGATTGAGGDPTLGKTTGKSATLTQSQLDGLVAQIKQCLNIPAGAGEAGLSAQLQFTIDPQGNVDAMPTVLDSGNTPLDRAYVSAAQRAVMRCGPYVMAVNQDVAARFDAQAFM
jgi:outer membrane biosynthesis protein TonB